MSFKNVVKAASVYLEGQSFAGVADEVALPDISMMMGDYRGPNMVGPVARFTGIERLEVEMTFNGIFPDVLKQLGSPDIRAKNYTIRKATESSNGDRKLLVAEFSGRGSAVSDDPFSGDEDPAQTTLTVQLVSYKLTFDNEVIYDIDMENGKFIVGGEDHWTPLTEDL